MGSWPPCTYCRAAIGYTDEPVPPVPPMVATIYQSIEANEPRVLPPPESTAAAIGGLASEFFAHVAAQPPVDVEYVTRAEYDAAIVTLRHELAALSADHKRAMEATRGRSGDDLGPDINARIAEGWAEI